MHFASKTRFDSKKMWHCSSFVPYNCSTMLYQKNPLLLICLYFYFSGLSISKDTSFRKMLTSFPSCTPSTWTPITGRNPRLSGRNDSWRRTERPSENRSTSCHSELDRECVSATIWPRKNSSYFSLLFYTFSIWRTRRGPHYPVFGVLPGSPSPQQTLKLFARQDTHKSEHLDKKKGEKNILFFSSFFICCEMSDGSIQENLFCPFSVFIFSFL